MNKKVSVEDLPPGDDHAPLGGRGHFHRHLGRGDEAQRRAADRLGDRRRASARATSSTCRRSSSPEAATEAATQLSRQASARNLGRLAGWGVGVLMVLILLLVLRAVVQQRLPREAFAIAGLPGEGAEGLGRAANTRRRSSP